MLVKVYLPENDTEKYTVINGLMSKYKSVVIRKEADGKVVAECSDLTESRQLEIHPVTGKPILLD
jgi:hypothetical protein